MTKKTVTAAEAIEQKISDLQARLAEASAAAVEARHFADSLPDRLAEGDTSVTVEQIAAASPAADAAAAITTAVQRQLDTARGELKEARTGDFELRLRDKRSPLMEASDIQVILDRIADATRAELVKLAETVEASNTEFDLLLTALPHTSIPDGIGEVWADRDAAYGTYLDFDGRRVHRLDPEGWESDVLNRLDMAAALDRDARAVPAPAYYSEPAELQAIPDDLHRH
ncbi:hypothetical protein [Arthrobacter roseus]|uniref:hypothetical protein n=1 Tax=Arthrobacter roseus TaxID=136274 RepID=UPI001965860C|nr:hypothetical protein [Arthrobacter roseus]MBM7848804.1 hypothetical protein [Arthrobacter roseus]